MKIIFAKYNRNRLPRFQTVTKIVEDCNGIRYAIKEPLSEESNEHINNIIYNYHLLKNYKNIKINKPKKENNYIIFQMEKGLSLDKLLLETILNQDEYKFEHYVDIFIAYIDTCVSKKNVIFRPSKEFISVFGEWLDDDPQDIIQIANIDLIFENIFIKNNKFTIIDYEWVFDFNIPKNYIIWRAFNQFCSNNLESIISEKFKNILNNKIKNKSYFENEIKFQNYVYGENKNHSLPSQLLKDVHFIETDSSQKINPSRKYLEVLTEHTKDDLKANNVKYFLINHLSSKQKFVFPLIVPSSIQSIKIIPLRDTCAIKILKIFLVDENNVELDLLPFMFSNALIDKDNILFFDTTSPQIFFNGLSSDILEKSKYIFIEIEYLFYGKEALVKCLQTYKEEQNKFILKLSKKNTYKIVFFGASSALEKRFNLLKEMGIIPDYICDNDKNKHGKYFEDYKIKSPSEIFQKNEDFFVLITSSYVNEIKQQIKKFKNIIIISNLWELDIN